MTIIDDDIGRKAQIYTDIQGLKELQYTKNKDAAKKEIAQQFEAMFMQIVLRSMRDATKAVSSGLFGNSQMEIYQDMFDKQISLMMSNAKLGFAKLIEDNMDQLSHPQTKPSSTLEAHKIPADIASAPSIQRENKFVPIDNRLKYENKSATHALIDADRSSFTSAEEFVKKLWSTAKKAASVIGTMPEILLAQAALETNWGKNILPQNQAQSSYNLFNIKAGSDWNKKTVMLDTIEQKNGILVKEKSKFRSYESYKESFMDYVNLLKGHTRYSTALNKASDPRQFIEAVHEAGYATDPGYADKVLKIFGSSLFQHLVAKAKTI